MKKRKCQHSVFVTAMFHLDVMVALIQMFMSAALHFGHKHPSSPGLVCVEVTALDYLRLIEETLGR